MVLISLGLSLLALPAAMAFQVFDVAVGRDGLVYTPEYVNASPGDIINFVMHPKNHTVTQNAFESPCVPLYGGINSGFVPVPAEVTGLPNFPVLVNDTNPVWFHCEQTGHCGKGMIFAINPPPDPSPHSFSAEKALAIAINGTLTTTTATSTSTAASSTSTPTNHMVTVGKDGKLRFDPEYINAAVGDTVTYSFFPKNHTVTQSNFAEPCQPKADTSPYHSPGFDSGFMPVAPNDTTPHLFTITINDTNPVWAYCRQVGHCGQGMVMAINPASSGSNTFYNFQMLAEKINGTSTTTMATATSTSTAAGSTSTPTNHMVTVGKDGKLRFDPEYINAAVGDTVTYSFFPKNHTVTQSNFAEPCQPKADTSPYHSPGFDSGFMPVAPNDTTPHLFTITVNDTNPVWAYCRQVGHCGQGMVMAINPASSGSNTFANFQMLAEKINGTSTTTTSTSTAASATSTPTNHMVTVGKDGKLRFDPEYINAAVGDTVTYSFFPKNHTVTQSNFAEPCQPKADTSPDHSPGFDSGFMPVAPNDTTPHLFTITVNDTNPVWAYCRQVGHCGQGMVMAINPASSGSNTFYNFQMLAEKINGTASASSSAPMATSTGYGSTYGSSSYGSSSYGSSNGSSSYASTVHGAVDNAAVSGSSENNNGGLTRNTYIIIGLLVVLLLGLIGLAVFMLFRKRKGYKAVPDISTRSVPDILPYSRKEPYSTPYGSADAEEYRD